MSLHRSCIAFAFLFTCGGSFALGEDCNLNGIEDEQDIADGTSADWNVNFVPDECELDPLPFRPVRLPGALRVPRYLVAADFDRDGDLDLLVGDTIAGLVLFGNSGDGDLLPFANVRTGRSIRALAAGDVDGDGFLDAAVVLADGSAQFMRFDGFSFLDPVAIRTDEALRTLAMGDVDGDGIDEVVLATRDSNRILIDLDGTLEPTVGFPTCDEPRQLALADFDGDGRLDIAAACAGSDDLAIHIASTGRGIFNLAGRYSIGGLPRALIAADLNGDALPDLCLVSPNYVATLANDGQGGFAETAFLPVHQGTSLAAADVDDDGDEDLAVARLAGPGVVFLINDGEGSMLGSVETTVTTNAVSVVSGDFTGDGSADLAVMDITEWGESPLLLTRGPEIEIPRFDRTSFHSPRPSRGVLGDVDADGDLDVITSVDRIDSLSTLLYRNQGDGNFLPGEDVIAEQTWLGPLFGVDVHGDQAVDLVAPDAGRILLSDGEGNFSTRPLGSPGWGTFASGADLDGDGALDIVTSGDRFSGLNVYRGAGDGTFAAPVELNAQLNVNRLMPTLSLGDFDGDGLVDICVTTFDSELLVFINLGDLNFSPPEWYFLSGFLASGDFDSDGHLDLAVAGGDKTITILWNQGDGTFAPADPFRLVHQPASLVAADLDQDGRPDLVTVNPDGDSVSILMNDEQGFRPPVDVWVGTNPRWVDSGDVDGDGDLDLVTTNEKGAEVSILWNRAELLRGPPEFRRGDVDADGSLRLTDAVVLLGHLFQGAAATDCMKTADATDDGEVDLTDVVAILGHLFGGARLAPPVESCGGDPTPDAVSCESYPACAGR